MKFQKAKWLSPNLKANCCNANYKLSQSHQDMSRQTNCNLANQGTSSWSQTEQRFQMKSTTSSSDIKLVSFPNLWTRKLSWALPCRVLSICQLDGYKEKHNHSAPQRKMCENAVQCRGKKVSEQFRHFPVLSYTHKYFQVRRLCFEEKQQRKG